MKTFLYTLILVASLAIDPAYSKAKKRASLGQDVHQFLESKFTNVKNVRIHPEELGSKSWTIWISSEYSVIGLSNKDRKSLRFILHWWPDARDAVSEKTEVEFVKEIHKALVGSFKNIPNKFHFSHSMMRKSESSHQKDESKASGQTSDFPKGEP